MRAALDAVGAMADALAGWPFGQAGRRAALLTAVEAGLRAAIAAAGQPKPVAAAADPLATAMMDRNIDVAMAINEAAIANAEMVGQLRAVDLDAQTISAATEETVTGVSEISMRSQEVAALAAAALESARSGRTAVGGAVSSMREIASAVEQAAGRVRELSEASERIVSIVTAIETIAAQTNLLALNATIEAARAGEAGKGFAVVATEVKNLASQTAKATEDIRTRIASLRADMDSIVQSMAQGTEAVAGGERAMAGVDAGMETISQGIEQTNQRMAEIAAILSQQATAANEMAAGVARIASKSADNAKSIMRNVEATRGVERLLGEQLQVLMERDIPDKIIKIAKVDHVMWKKRLADMMVGLETLRPAELTSHEACRLGKWYYGPGSALYRDNMTFKRLEDPHRRVHAHGKAAAEAYNRGDQAAAMAEIAKVEQASTEVLRLLDLLAKEAPAMPRQAGF
ncbi:MAG: hypothetical protein OHK0024_06730 [Thalassobaculales bacterium]